jgi:hypothetical protein
LPACFGRIDLGLNLRADFADVLRAEPLSRQRFLLLARAFQCGLDDGAFFRRLVVGWYAWSGLDRSGRFGAAGCCAGLGRGSLALVSGSAPLVALASGAR